MAEHMWLGRIGFQFQKAGVSVGWFPITGWPLTEALSWTAGRPPGTHFSSDHALVAGLLAGRRHPCWATGVSMCSILGTGEPHGQRTLVGYSPWGHKESDTPEQLTHTLSMCWSGGSRKTGQSHPSAWTIGSSQDPENGSHQYLMLEFLLSSLEELSENDVLRGMGEPPNGPTILTQVWLGLPVGSIQPLCHTCCCKSSLYTFDCVCDLGAVNL